MRTIISLLLFAFCIYCNAADPNAQLLSRVDNQVETMFNDLSVISNKSSSSASSKRIDFSTKYFEDPNLKAPNEFKNLGYLGRDNYNTDIRVERYVNIFWDMFRSEKYEDYTFRYEKRSSFILPQPEFKDGESKPENAQVIIRKIYLKDGMPIEVFEDTLIVGTERLKIKKWANKSSRFHIGDYGGGEILNFEQIKTNASIAYGFKHYRKAYELYESLTKKFPDEGEPYYRMAVMLYKKEYGSSMSKKERDRLILEYLDKAIHKGTSTISSCADNMKYWITC